MSNSFSEEFYFCWHQPDELARLNDADRDRLGNDAMMGAGQTFRDGHVASRFAQHRQADLVRLLKPRFGQVTPDFALLTGDNEHRFEITEADRPGRRRTEEYRSDVFPPAMRSLAEDEWTTASDYKEAVKGIVRKKAAKKYDACHGLIVWSNAFGITDEELITVSWWSEACASAWGSFREIWVHHRDAFELITEP